MASVSACVGVSAGSEPTAAFAQAGQPEFEAVSIKPADPSAPARMVGATPGGYRGRNLRLSDLMMGAWHLNREQIVGGPNWLETAGWELGRAEQPQAEPTKKEKKQ